jgi:hypothetical protein
MMRGSSLKIIVRGGAALKVQSFNSIGNDFASSGRGSEH